MGNSLVVQWVELSALTARGPGSIAGRGTKIPQALQDHFHKLGVCILAFDA